MNSVTQQHSMSCGLACVAYIVQKPYSLLAEGELPIKLNQIGFYCPELVEKLNQFGHKYAWKKIESEVELSFNQGDIVFIQPSETYPGGHFLVKTTGGWMDSWINFEPRSADVSKATSGFRDNLPGVAEYLVYPYAA